MPVALFSNRSKAEPVQKRLVANGIPAEIHGELRLEKLWFCSQPATGVRIETLADYYERACNLLYQWDAADGVLRDAIRCPECKSLRVDYPQFTRKFLIPNLALGLFAALGAVEKQFYCEDCHFTWPKEGMKPRRERQHMGPYFFIEGVEQTALAHHTESHREAA
jgi:hypothetical protein